MGEHPLKKDTLAILPACEEEQLTEVVERAEMSLYDAQKRLAYIEERRRELELDAKEQNLESVDWLNRRIYGLIAEVTNPEAVERVMQGVESGKDLNEAVKAAQGIVKLRDDMLDRTLDRGANTGKHRKIEVAFANQGSSTVIGVKIDNE